MENLFLIINIGLFSSMSSASVGYLIAGLLFLGFFALSIWGFLSTKNNLKPRHITDAMPFFTRAWHQNKPLLLFCLGVISIISSLSFFLMIN